MERYQNPDDPLNSKKYHTGKYCIENNCFRPAGTHWSKLWCQKHNAERMKDIGDFLEGELKRLAPNA